MFPVCHMMKIIERNYPGVLVKTDTVQTPACRESRTMNAPSFAQQQKRRKVQTTLLGQNTSCMVVVHLSCTLQTPLRLLRIACCITVVPPANCVSSSLSRKFATKVNILVVQHFFSCQTRALKCKCTSILQMPVVQLQAWQGAKRTALATSC